MNTNFQKGHHIIKTPKNKYEFFVDQQGFIDQVYTNKLISSEKYVEKGIYAHGVRLFSKGTNLEFSINTPEVQNDFSKQRIYKTVSTDDYHLLIIYELEQPLLVFYSSHVNNLVLLFDWDRDLKNLNEEQRNKKFPQFIPELRNFSTIEYPKILAHKDYLFKFLNAIEEPIILVEDILPENYSPSIVDEWRAKNNLS